MIESKKMRPLFLKLSLAFIVLLPTIGQAQFRVSKLENYSNDEAVLIRRAARVSPFIPVILAESKTMISGNPLRIYTGSIMDPKILKEFSEWVNDWNKHDASKYGRLEAVNHAVEADVLIVCYAFRLSEDDLDSGLRSNQINPSNRIPVYSYLIVRKPRKLEITWRSFVFTNDARRTELSDAMANALRKRMKERPRVEK